MVTELSTSSGSPQTRPTESHDCASPGGYASSSTSMTVANRTVIAVARVRDVGERLDEHRPLRPHRGPQIAPVQADEGVASSHRNSSGVQVLSCQLGVADGEQDEWCTAVDRLGTRRPQAGHHLGAHRRQPPGTRRGLGDRLRRTTRRHRGQLQRAQRPVRARCGQPRQHVRARPARSPPAAPPATTSWSGCAAPARRAATRRPAIPARREPNRRRPRRPRRSGPAGATPGSARGCATPRSGWWGCRPRRGRRRRVPAHRPGRTAGRARRDAPATPAVVSATSGSVNDGAISAASVGRRLRKQRESLGGSGQQRDLVGRAAVPGGDRLDRRALVVDARVPRQVGQPRGQSLGRATPAAACDGC